MVGRTCWWNVLYRGYIYIFAKGSVDTYTYMQRADRRRSTYMKKKRLEWQDGNDMNWSCELIHFPLRIFSCITCLYNSPDQAEDRCKCRRRCAGRSNTG